MDNYLYKCLYCGKEYKPNRRKKQKYCSNSCRTRAFVTRNNKGLGLIKKDSEKKEPIKIEKMSIAGVANSAAGALAIQLATNLFTSEENKPATKKDLQNLTKSLQQRYHPILNIPPRNDGARPFYDLEAQTIVYLINSKKINNYGI